MRQVSRTTLGALKNVKFQLSRNSAKFDMVARKIPLILIEITVLPFFRKLEFSRVLHLLYFPSLIHAYTYTYCVFDCIQITFYDFLCFFFCWNACMTSYQLFDFTRNYKPNLYNIS